MEGGVRLWDRDGDVGMVVSVACVVDGRKQRLIDIHVLLDGALSKVTSVNSWGSISQTAII